MTAGRTDEFSEIVAALNAGDLPEVFALIERELAGDAGQERRYALLLMRARLRMVSDDPGLAFPDLDDALTLAGSTGGQAAVLQARAEAAEAVGELDMARADLERLIATVTDPTDLAAAEQVFGRVERDGGDIARAVALLENARRRLIVAGADDDRVAEVALDLAMALRLAGRAEESIALLREVAASAGPEFAARLLVQIGTSCAFIGDYDAALEAWAEALPMLADGDDRAVVRYNRAVAFRDMSRLDEARDDLQRGLVDNAGLNPHTEFDLLLLLGIVERERDDSQRSLNALGQAAALMPDGDPHGRARLEIGTTLAVAGLVGLAVEELGAAAQLCANPDDRARAFRSRGAARQELGLVDLALDDYSRAIEQTTDTDERARGQITRATILGALDRRREALIALGDAALAARDPEVARQVIVQRGALRSATGDLDGAIADLELGRDLAFRAGDDDLAARVAVDLGAIFVAVGREADAIGLFDHALATAAGGDVAFTALMHLGSVHVARREPLAALGAFERAAGAAHDDREGRARAFLARAGAAQRFQRFGEAAADYARVLTLQPGPQAFDQASIGRDVIANQIGSLERARAELTILMRAPEEPSFRAGPTLQRGLIALQLGDIAAAEIDLHRASRMYRLLPDRALAEACLALLSAHLGRCEDARQHLIVAADLDPAGAWKAQLADEADWNNCPGVTDEG